jgi:AraC-like DNA-binding protein
MVRAETSTSQHSAESVTTRPHRSLERATPTPEPTVSVTILGSLVGVVERAGITREQLLTAAQLDPAVLDAPDARLPRSKIYQLCASAMELTRDPALGLHWAERVDEGSFVPVSHLMAHAATLRQALDTLAQFHRLLSDQPCFELVECEDSATMRVRLRGESLVAQRFSAEMSVGGIFHLLRHVKARPLVELVGFEYAAPAYQQEYLRVFQGAVQFRHAFTGVVFDRALLDLPARRRDDEVHDALEALASRRLQRITHSLSYGAQVHDFLVRERKGRRTDMSVVARALHISVRSLRRRLSAEDKPYGEIANEALAVVAKHLLQDKQRSIQETAYELGFSSFSSFHRAFRRATGTTPSAFRNPSSLDDAP